MTPPTPNQSSGKKNLKFLDLFSGIGGFALPLTEAGNECIGFSEINKEAIKIYQKHFPTHANLGDITAIDAKKLPDFDLLVGGFPCQSFSIAGSRKGFNDTRGTLFFDIARIIKEKRPRCVLLENVKGLLSHDKGRTYKVILSTLTELGYDTEALVFDSYFFNAAPRERVYMLAMHREQKIDVRERSEQAVSLYLLFSQRFRSEDMAGRAEETGRGSERIIRAFAKLPDWMDGWDSVY